MKFNFMILQVTVLGTFTMKTVLKILKTLAGLAMKPRVRFLMEENERTLSKAVVIASFQTRIVR